MGVDVSMGTAMLFGLRNMTGSPNPSSGFSSRPFSSRTYVIVPALFMAHPMYPDSDWTCL